MSDVWEPIANPTIWVLAFSSTLKNKELVLCLSCICSRPDSCIASRIGDGPAHPYFLFQGERIELRNKDNPYYRSKPKKYRRTKAAWNKEKSLDHQQVPHGDCLGNNPGRASTLYFVRFNLEL